MHVLVLVVPRYRSTDKRLTVFCGAEPHHPLQLQASDRQNAKFLLPRAVCRDPLSATGYFLCDETSIRYFDEAKDRVTPLVGSYEPGEADGVGTDAQFKSIGSVIVTSDGQTIWCSDEPAGLRRIDIPRRDVRTVCRCYARGLVWDRALNKSDAAFYYVKIDTRMTGGARLPILGRYDIASDASTSYAPRAGAGAGVKSFCVTPTGVIVFSQTSRVFVFNPMSGDIEMIESIEVDLDSSLVLLDSTQQLVAVKSGALVTYTLPPQCFSSAKML